MISETKRKISSLEKYLVLKERNLDLAFEIMNEATVSLSLSNAELQGLKQYLSQIESSAFESFCSSLLLQNKSNLVIRVLDQIKIKKLEVTEKDIALDQATNEWRIAYSEYKSIESVIDSKKNELNDLYEKIENKMNDEIGQLLFNLRRSQ